MALMLRMIREAIAKVIWPVPSSPLLASPLRSAANREAVPTLRILDRLAERCWAASCEEVEASEAGALRQLADHYAVCAERVAAMSAFSGPIAIRDDFPEDDGSPDFVKRVNVYVPGGEAEIDTARARSPWAHLFSDPACGIFLVCGQSNAANHGDGLYRPRGEVFSLNFMDLRSYIACDPLPGASGNGGSIWPRLGELLLERGLFKRVLFVPVAFGGTYVTDWTAEGRTRRRLTLAISRLQKRLGASVLDFDAVFWQQGEAEANLTDMGADTYAGHFLDVVALLRNHGVFCPIFVTQSTVCNGPQPHPFRNHAAIRDAQLRLADPSIGILRGPDTDLVGPSGRSDGCHFAAAGLQQTASLWLEAIEANRHLLITDRRGCALAR